MIPLVIDPVAIRLGGLEIRWYGIIIAFAIYLATIIADKEATKKGYRKDFVVDIVFRTLPISLIGARLYYVLFNLSYYAKNPAEIIQFWHGGIAIYGGLLAGGLTVWWLCKREDVSFLLLMDILAPVVLLGQAMGRWGNFTNQEAHGEMISRAFLEGLYIPNFIIEQMNINGQYYQPTFLYESIWSFIGVVILLYLRKKKIFRVGEIFFSYVIWYSIGRFFIEGLRTDSLYLTETIRVSQLLSVILFIIGISMVIYRRIKLHNQPLYVDVTSPRDRRLW